jgi:hypothetical protein
MSVQQPTLAQMEAAQGGHPSIAMTATPARTTAVIRSWAANMQMPAMITIRVQPIPVRSKTMDH